jgi:hypothetical protein
VPLADEQLADVAADVGLGASRQALAGDRAHRPIRRSRRGSQALDLVGVLHPSQLPHRRTGRDELGGIQGGAQPEREAGPHLVLDGDATRGSHECLDGADGVFGLVPRHDLEVVDELAESVSRERLLEPWQDEHRLAIDRDEQAGQPLERRGGVPEEVRVVR